MNAHANWDKETDVVVVGYGYAGAVSAIEAHDGGAKVCVIEKMAHSAGASAASGGSVAAAADAEKIFNYLRIQCGGRTSEDVLRAFCEGLVENPAYVKKLAEISGAEVRVRLGEASRFAVFDHPGREAYGNIRIGHIPGFSGIPGISRPGGGARLMKVLMDNVSARKIQVAFSTPAARLMTDAGGAIVGVKALHSGKEIALKARKAVILACGGFEQGIELQRKFLQGSKYISYCHPSNTGDGIRMAQAVGADLSGMWHLHGSYGFEIPGFSTGFRHTGAGGNRGRYERLTPTPWIVVDKFGRRYMNEIAPMPQDLNHRCMEIFDGSLWLKPYYKEGSSGYPRIPNWLIFDEEGRKNKPIGATHWEDYRWSKDNSAEIEKGWIAAEDSLSALAARIQADPDNDGKMSAVALEATVARWNEIVTSGRMDPDFRRGPKSYFKPIATPPFYTLKCWPIITNTQGGPVHNARQQILDVFGATIPRLYAAGELGSLFQHVYETAGNIGECFSSGRIAGRNAAAEKPWG